MSVARLRHLLQHDSRFRYLSVDGLNWIDPYTGTLVQAPFDWQEGALAWLREHQPWTDHEPRSDQQLQLHRWRIHLRTQVVEDPSFRRFDPEGRWLNPYTGQWVAEVRRQGKAITSATIKDMAAALVACPEAERGEPLPAARIQALVDAAKRPASPAASGPSPVIKIPGGPVYGGGDMRIKRRIASSDEHVTQRAIRPSDLIAGYRVLSRIGTGGMSAVYRARQEGASHDVALKVLQAHGSRAEAFAERFGLEAKAAKAVDHPNVVPVYDFGRDGGKLFMTMELMDGGDVEHLMEEAGRPLSERRALEILRDATAGLAALHRARIIHRDVKPSNLFVGADGRAKIGDLGLAKQSGNDSNITVDGAAVGTPAFMAPEQARGDPLLDHRVDIYGMGATLFMLLTGKPPYHGGNVFTIVRRVLSEPVPDVRQRNQAVGTATAALIATATDKDPERRYPDADAMLAAIEAALAEAQDRPPQLVDQAAQTATIRHRLSDQVSTERALKPQSGAAALTPSHEHVALERRIDPAAQLTRIGLQLGLFEARADLADYYALRLMDDRPLLLLVHTAGVDPDLRGEVIQGLDAIIDDVVATVPESTGELFARFHRHLRKAGLPEFSAIGVMCSTDGEQVCVSVAGTQPPCRFGDPTTALDLRQVGFRDGPLGAHEHSSREAWVDLPRGGGLALFSPGTMEACDAEGTAFDLPHLAASLVINADLGAQDLAEAIGEDVDSHAEGRLERDATIIVLKRACGPR